MYVCTDCGLSQPHAGNCPNDATAMVDGADDVLLGQTVGAYRVAKLMGVGGMGRVYKGVHPSIGSRVAIKVLSRECADKPDLVERFFSEARAVNLIRHESIVNVLDLAQLPDGRPYIIMEYLDGAPLASMVEVGPLPLGSMCRLLGEALEALAAAHAKGIVHRDLKPDNIYVSQSGRPKILDFGIAKLRPELGGSATQTGSLLGTPHYMSPEQAMGKQVDLRTDIYAMGVILFECATGRRPFIADSLFDLLRQHVDQQPPSPRSFRPDMPPALEQVILYALAKDPLQRYGSAADLAQALQGASQGLAPDQWTPILPSTLQRLTAQHGASSGAGWGTPASWPPGAAHAAHPPSQPPRQHLPTGPGSQHPPPAGAYPGYGPPPSLTGASGQVVGMGPPRSRKGLWMAVAGVVVAGGAIALVVAATAGKKDEQAAGPGTGSGSTENPDPLLGSGSGSTAGTGDGTGSGSGSGSNRIANGHGSDDDDDEIVEDPDPTPKPGAGGLDAATAKRVADFRSSVPECDEFIRTMAAMAACPAMASGATGLAATLDNMMKGFAQYRGLPQSARPQAAASCKDGATNTRAALVGVGCKAPAASIVTTDPDSDPTPMPDLPRDKPYPVTIKGFNADAWDYMAWFPTALAEARKLFPDAQVTRIDADGVSSDGKVHLALSDDFDVLFRFVSPSAAKRPASHPKGLKWEPLCMVQIIIDKDDAMVLPMQGFGCEEPIALPRCNARQVWARAIERGAPADNAFAELWYGYSNGKWSFEIEGDDQSKGFDVTLLDGC